MTETSRVRVRSDSQESLPIDRLVREEAPGEDTVSLDVLFVGGGPAGLAGAIALARDREPDSPLHGLEIGLLEKASALGEHSLSGAIVNPVPLQRLLPDVAASALPFRGPVRRDRVYLLGRERRLRVPVPPTMLNRGNYVASLCA